MPSATTRVIYLTAFIPQKAYRIESPANSSEARLFVDGVFLQSWTAGPTGVRNGFTFGDGIGASGYAGDADWNYARVYQDLQLTSIPEPTTLLPLGTGLAIAGYRRRRK